ncbi:MAG: porin family protein [Bacteroidales bacterium]|jgi:outer membrane protein W|nr:porin family protein [Bacteroidales bacterium]
MKKIMVLIAIIAMGISVNAQAQQEGTKSAISEKPQKKIANTTSRKGFEIGLVPFGSILGFSTSDFIDTYDHFNYGYTTDIYEYLMIEAFLNYRFSSNFALGVGAVYSNANVIYFQAEYNFNTQKPKLSPFVGIYLAGRLVEEVRMDFIYNQLPYGSEEFRFGMGAKVGVRYSFDENWAIEGSIKMHYIPHSFAISVPIGIVYHF